MAGDWIKMRTGLESNPKLHAIARAINENANVALFLLYKLASWFRTHGKHGKMDCQPSVLDFAFNAPGLSEALIKQDWLRVNGGILTLHGFCDTSAIRKGLGRKIRAEVLAAGKCAACSSTDDLVIDHIIPIALGGSCDRSNLQALCADCNISKGKKHPGEWMGRNG